MAAAAAARLAAALRQRLCNHTPWEDWAETWAHYLHITDTLETAAACGLSLQPQRRQRAALEHIALQSADRAVYFDQLIADWFPVAYVLNNLNRGMGLPDAYPFVLSGPQSRNCASCTR